MITFIIVHVACAVLLAMGGVVFYETLRVKLMDANSAVYSILVILPSVSFIYLSSSDLQEVGISFVIFLLIFFCFPVKKIKQGVRSRYEQIISDIPFFDDRPGKFSSILIVILLYWIMAAFFLLQAYNNR